eukprot:TRINITY_DN2782_c0_g1_i3.p1 TRINITY_DN2782_c0_g1~~TRINITY_DN2782_c0_g1_i3.p1  ORF type:complete len:370 (-),score=180.80 TRINITY_DN2782_c0_g1_i3:1682-2791(-)
MAALFGNSGRGSGPKPLVEFRAGKMTMKGNMVHPDKRKGLVYIEQGEDQLMRFKWKDRVSGSVEDDLIIFPDDIEFKKVPACTTGRVYLLKFKASSRKIFYWMQEPKSDRDEELAKKVNDYLNNPSSIHASSGSSGRGSAISGLDLNNLQDTELQSLLSNMSQQQLVNLFSAPAGSGISSILSGGASRQRSSASGSRSSRVAGTTKTASSASPSVTSGNEWSSIKVPEGSASSSSAAAKEPPVDLSSSINAEVLQPLLENKDFVDKMKELLPKDTEAGEKEDESKKAASSSSSSPAKEIKGTVQSPQFQQALSVFSTALQSGQLAPLVREFNLGDEAVEAASQGSMEDFIKALQKTKASGEEEEKMMTD